HGVLVRLHRTAARGHGAAFAHVPSCVHEDRAFAHPTSPEQEDADARRRNSCRPWSMLTDRCFGGIIAARIHTIRWLDKYKDADELRWIAFLLAALVGLIALFLFEGSSPAQTSGVIEIANYQGQDRTQRLIDGAKREGSLTFYSNAPTEDNAALVGAFEKKY